MKILMYILMIAFLSLCVYIQLTMPDRAEKHRQEMDAIKRPHYIQKCDIIEYRQKRKCFCESITKSDWIKNG